jgi:hypothetical protein
VSQAPFKELPSLQSWTFFCDIQSFLQRALQAKGQSVANVKLEDHEKMSVEATMVRYRFGPWDHRYREYLNIMSAKQLVNVTIEGRTTIIALTSVGQAQAKKLGAVSNFEAYVRRTKLLKANFDMTATNLMRFIYNTFPEIISLKKKRSDHPMNISLTKLQINTKKSTEVIDFSQSVTFLHGPVSTGKSSVARMIDYCFGGGLERTPAIQQEFISVGIVLHFWRL